MYVVKHWFMKCLTFVYQVYCVYLSVKPNVMTTCPTAPIFLAELRLGPAGLWSQCYYCTLIFNNFEMFRMKLFDAE